MTNGRDGGSDDGPALQPSLSARVLLEVAVLASDTVASADLPSPADNSESRERSVLVTAGDADVRHYVRDCLRPRTDLHVLEAGSTAAMLDAAAMKQPRLFIVDEPQVAAVLSYPSVPVILLADEIPELLRDRARAAQVVLLPGPFQARGLLEQVNRLLQDVTTPNDSESDFP